MEAGNTMSKTIPVVSFDPSMSNWGICLAEVDIDTLEVKIEDLMLVRTESEKLKGVDKSSDDIRRAHEIYRAVTGACRGRAFAISEIPFFNPAGYAAANHNTGFVVGVLGCIDIPIIQVRPREVKLVSIGHSQASKEEMIAWAATKHPEAPWIYKKSKGNMVLTQANEHLADAVASMYAGLLTAQFRQAIGVFNSMTDSTVKLAA